MKIGLNGSYELSHQTLWGFVVFIFHVVSKLMTGMENLLVIFKINYMCCFHPVQLFRMWL